MQRKERSQEKLIVRRARVINGKPTMRGFSDRTLIQIDEETAEILDNQYWIICTQNSIWMKDWLIADVQEGEEGNDCQE